MFATKLHGLPGYGHLFQARHNLLNNQIFPQLKSNQIFQYAAQLEAARQNILTNIARSYLGLLTT